MSSNPVIGIDIAARLDRFREELARIPDIGGREARQLAAQMEREIRRAERAARAAARASEDAADATRRFGSAAGRTGASAGKLAGALDLIVPGAGGAARAVADLADVGEVAAEGGAALGLTLGTVAVATGVLAAVAGAGYLAWRGYREEQERVEAASRIVKETEEKLTPVLNAQRDAVLRLRVAQGELTREEAAALQGHNRLTAQMVAAVQPLMDQANALEKQRQGWRAYLLELAEGATRTVPALALMGPVVEGLGKSQSDLAAEMAPYDAAIRRTIKEHETLRTVTDEAAAAESKAAAAKAAAAKAAAAAIRAETEAMREHSEERSRYIQGQREMLEAQRDARQHTATVEQEAADAREQAMLEQLAFDLAIDEERTKRVEEEARQRIAAREEEARQTRDIALRFADVAATIYDGVADAAIDAKRREVEGGKASAKELFETEKAAGIARALIAGAVASAQSWASYIGQGWQTALGYQLAVAAETTAAVVMIAAQQSPVVAHQGMAPDEFPARLRQGEGVLNPNGVAAVGGPDGVRRANSEGPMASAGQQVVYATVLDGRVVSSIAAKEIRKRGGPLGDLDRAARGKIGYHNHYAGSRGVL